MKIGIITVHDSANLGSYLQALGMQELVLENGDTPVILKTRNEFSALCIFLGYNNIKSVRSIKSFVYFFLKSILSLKQTIKKYQKFKVYRKDWELFKNIKSIKTIHEGDLDVLLLGSDEIWNVNQPAFQNSYFYGINIPAQRKYAYAISVGNVENEKWEKFPDLVSGIQQLDGILVRDSYTKEILQKNRIFVDEKICDPTIQVDIRKYMKKVEDVRVPKGDYFAVYSYAVDEHTADILKQFAEKYKLKLVAISLYQSWCDEYVNCSPLDFGAILEKAKYVYTTTFHGTIFSALYHKNFVVNPFSQKVVDVINLLELNNYTLPSSFDVYDLENLLLFDRNYDKTEKIIFDLRSKSSEIYKKYIKVNTYQEN